MRKINSRNFTYDGLTFSCSSFLLEQVKDEIWKQKLDGLTHTELKENIINTITNIPKDKYRKIIKGAYERPEKYVSNKNKTRKIKKNYL
jgi:hypothetical protein